MLKKNFRTQTLFCTCAVITFCSQYATSNELNGQTASGRKFVVEMNGIAKSPSSDGIWGVMKLTYKVGGSKKTQENYTFPIGAPASISKNRLGLVTISEKNGGMNGIYSVTYLYPGDDGFITFGTAELSMDNGKYTEINRISPEWIKRASANDRFLFIRSIVSHSDIFIDSGQNQSLDDAMLFFCLA